MHEDLPEREAAVQRMDVLRNRHMHGIVRFLHVVVCFMVSLVIYGLKEHLHIHPGQTRADKGGCASCNAQEPSGLGISGVDQVSDRFFRSDRGLVAGFQGVTSHSLLIFVFAAAWNSSPKGG